jgi:hypothetical protein
LDVLDRRRRFAALLAEVLEPENLEETVVDGVRFGGLGISESRSVPRDTISPRAICWTREVAMPKWRATICQASTKTTFFSFEPKLTVR